MNRRDWLKTLGVAGGGAGGGGAGAVASPPSLAAPAGFVAGRANPKTTHPTPATPASAARATS